MLRHRSPKIPSHPFARITPPGYVASSADQDDACVVRAGGFSLHGGVGIAAHVAHPPVAIERLSIAHQGHIRYRLLDFIAHQRRSRLAAGHVLGRAAQVDIDDRGARIFGNARAFFHPSRFTAGELHDMQAGAMISDAPARHAMLRGMPAAGQSRARGHFRYDQARAMRRNGASVTPDIGASNTGLGSATGPIEGGCML